MRGPAQALDVADVLHLNDALPRRTDHDFAAKPLVIDRLATEETGQHVVTNDLCHWSHDRGCRLRQCTRMHSEHSSNLSPWRESNFVWLRPVFHRERGFARGR